MSKFKASVLNAVGFLCVVCAIIGVFVPGWPTTIFVIIASICFSKANPKMQKWLMQSKLLGPYLENYHNKTGITMAYKIRTVAFMWSGMLATMAITATLWLIVLLCVIGILVTWHVFAIKTRIAENNEIYNFKYNMFTIAISWIWLAVSMFFMQPIFWMYAIVIALGVLVFTLPILIYAFKARQKMVNKATKARLN